MQSAEWLKIKEIFYQTLDLPETARERFLANQEDSVRSEVVQLIASHEQAEDFIAEPAVAEFGLDDKNQIGKNIGGYKILEVIGAGGMGTVYLAEKEGLEKKVALKIIKRGMDTDAVLRRFIQERQILSRLEHPNIATLLDGGTTEDGLPFFVMEYVEGLPVTKFCEEHQLDLKERLDLFRQICSAVAYSHQNLIVHRDLKPSNILTTKDGTPKLLDFGIAKLLNLDGLENTATATQGRIFTPEYASPEQLNGLPITTSTDVYSLGIVLYELLSRTRPFNSTGKSYQEIANLVLTQEPLRPSSVVSRPSPIDEDTFEYKGQRTNDDGRKTNPKSKIQNLKSLRGDLDNIILKALRKEPERRYQSVQEFSEDIRRYLVDLPVTATADSSVYRFKKFVSRHQIGTIFAALILTVSGFAVWQGIVATRERAKAETHVAQVRDVAKSLLNETSQNLQNLPNGSEVRQQLIEKAAMTLNSLSAEVDDAEFLSELGYAYHQLGWTQIWHLRDFEKASQNLQKARALHERAVELEPNNPKYLLKLVGTMGSLLEFYQQQGNTESVVEIYQTNIKINLRRIELEPNNSRIYFDNSGFYSDLHEVFGGLHRDAESLDALNKSFEMIERAVELQQAKEQTPDVQSQLAFMLMQKGSLLEKSNKKDEALLVYGQAAEIADQAYAADNTQKLGFNHSVRLRNMMADIYRGRSDWQKVLELQEFCLNRLQQNKENKSLDQKNLPSGIATYTIRIGITLDKLGKKDEGRENVEKGLNLYLANLKKFENLAADILHAQGFFILASDYYFANNQNRKAADLWQKEFINRLETILKKTSNDNGMRNQLADGFWRKGDALCGFQDSNNSISETNTAFLKEALENYEKSLHQVQKILSLGESSSATKQKGESIERRILLLRDKLARK